MQTRSHNMNVGPSPQNTFWEFFKCLLFFINVAYLRSLAVVMFDGFLQIRHKHSFILY